jgi:phage terminase small subunit
MAAVGDEKSVGVPLKNAKHEAVLQHYLQSADRVGWKSYRAIYRRSSQRAAETAWSRLLKDAEFAARKTFLENAVVERVIEKTGITKERVLEELALIGFGTLKDVAVVFHNGDIESIDREHAAKIQELVVDSYQDGHGDDAREVKRVKLKLWDKRAALVDIGRELGMFKNRHQLTGGDDGPIEVADVTEAPSELDIVRRIAFALERAGRKLKTDPPAPKAAAKRKQ